MDPFPAWTGSLSTSLRYKKWQLSALLDVKHGGQVWNGTRGALYNFGTHKDTEQRADCPTLTTCTGNDKVFGQGGWFDGPVAGPGAGDRKSTRLNSSHLVISYAVFCLKKKKK